MRDRLIELLNEAHEGWLHYVDNCAFNQTALSFTFGQMFADHLLANGVIVPPCKVGDTVYSIRGFDGKPEQCEPYTVTDITIYENTITIHIMDGWLFIRNMYPDDFGKTVFLTREEAEAKLKGEQEW